MSNALADRLNEYLNKKIIYNTSSGGGKMFSDQRRRINKRCVSVRAYEKEPEYYSFCDNYYYGDGDYEEDSE